MQYLGGKSRIAARISEQILARGGGKARYVEPFMGSGAVLAKVAPHFSCVLGSDSQEDLMELWKAAQDGWEPPTSLSKAEYLNLRGQNTPSALRGFAAFGLSFGGKYFAGYASNSRGDDYCGAARRNVLKRVTAFKHAELACQDYRKLVVTSQDVIYCDPPYAGTTEYSGVEQFDSAEFWCVVTDWANLGAIVLVSEYVAPGNTEVVWEHEATTSLKKDDNRGKAVEKLFLVLPTKEEPSVTDQETGLQLHDGRQLPATTDLRRVLREGLDSVLAQEFNARGGQEVEKPEDAFPLLRRLGAMSETARDYSRAFAEFARETEARAGDDLIEMYGEQDGVPNQGAKVPDADGTVIKVSPDYVNEYAFDVDALISAHIARLFADTSFRAQLEMMFRAEFLGDGDRSTAILADVLAEAVHGVLALGKFQPQVTKTRALAKLLSQYGQDGVASTIGDATSKTVKHKGTKIERDYPKEK